MKQTPGPKPVAWRVEDTNSDYTFRIYDEKGNYPKESEASVCRLIEAAPELLAAAAEFVATLEGNGKSAYVSSRLRAVISKATGGGGR